MESEITKDDFIRIIKETMRRENLPFIEALYQVLEREVEKCKDKAGIQFVCQKGCSYCCQQLVTCTKIEFGAISRYIRSLPINQQNSIRQAIRGVVRSWDKYFRKKERLLEVASPQLVHDDWSEKPCPFLSERDGTCMVYPVRPIDCRTFISEIKCGKNTKFEGVKRMRFDPEKWANNLILEEEKRVNIRMAVTPLSHWLLLKFFDRTNKPKVKQDRKRKKKK